MPPPSPEAPESSRSLLAHALNASVVVASRATAAVRLRPSFNVTSHLWVLGAAGAGPGAGRNFRDSTARGLTLPAPAHLRGSRSGNDYDGDPDSDPFTADGPHPASIAASRPVSESRLSRPGSGATSTWQGTTSTVQPAACADAAPVAESSIANVSLRVDPELLARHQVGLGVGLAPADPVPGDDGGEGARRQGRHHGRGEPLVGHGDERARDALLAELGQQLQRAGAERDVVDHAGDDGVQEPLDDHLGREVDAGVLGDVATGVHQVVADEVERVLGGPGAAVLGDQGVLRVHPVRLGVDQRAVHVPQDRRRPPVGGGVGRVGGRRVGGRRVGGGAGHTAHAPSPARRLSPRARSRGWERATARPPRGSSPCGGRSRRPGHASAGPPRSTARRGGRGTSR